MTLKRIFLVSVLAVLTVAAAMGVAALTASTSKADVLLELMFALDVYAVTTSSAGYVFHRGRWRLAMVLSMVAGAIALGLYLFLAWFELDFRESTWLRWFFFKLAVAGIALPLSGLLSLTRFRHAALGSVRTFTITFVLLTAGMIGYLDWSEAGHLDYRVVGVLVVVSVLGMLSLPLLQYLAQISQPAETIADRTSAAVTCPRCALNQSLARGASRCARCRLRITIEFEEPRCPKCDYLLYQLTEPRCPECGESLGADEVVPVAGATGTGSAT